MVTVLEELKRNKFLLVLINEEQYIEQIREIVKSIERENAKICYVCLSRPYEDVIESLKANNILLAPFMFVDVLSSHYSTPKPAKNCIFLDSPANLDAIHEAIKQIVKNGDTRILLFDTISAMLMYQEIFPVLRFTHKILSEKENTPIKKVYLVIKEVSSQDKENAELLSDLTMFADKVIEAAPKKI